MCPHVRHLTFNIHPTEDNKFSWTGPNGQQKETVFCGSLNSCSCADVEQACEHG